MSAVQLNAVTFRYGAATRDALSGVSLSIASGTICWIYGRAGAGASTLLLVAAGLAPRFTGGELSGGVRLLDEDPASNEGRRRLRGRMAYVTSAPDLQLSGIAETVREEVAFGPANLGWPVERIREATALALERLAIQSLAERRPASLSGGEKQRVVIASLLALAPDAWLIDEADSALDVAGRRLVTGILRSERDRGSAIVVARDEPDAMAGLADRVILLEEGMVAYDGAPRALLESEQAWSRGPGGTAAGALARAAHALHPHPRLAVPYPIGVDEALARWR